MVDLGSSPKDQVMTGEVLGSWKELAGEPRHKLGGTHAPEPTGCNYCARTHDY